MRYYKTINDVYITSIGNGSGGTEISAREYADILETILSKPTAPEGFDYRLKTDLTWEEYEKPEPDPEPEKASSEDYEEALQQMGVDFSD